MCIRTFVCTLLTLFSIFTLWGREPIVPYSLKEHKDFSLASKFIEHYHGLLKQSRTEAVADTLRQIKENGVKFTVGNEAKWASLVGDEEFNLSLRDGIYSACWSRDGRHIVAFSFPARMDLLTLSNKIQLEEMMLARLMEPGKSERSHNKPTMSSSFLKKVPYSSFYIDDAGFFITPRLAHQVVYQPLDSITGQSVLLTGSPTYSLESISNTMLTGYSSFPITLKVNIECYGAKVSPLSLDLSELFEILSSEGSVPYWGVDECDDIEVQGLYVWVNHSGGFAHVLNMKLPMSAVSDSAEGSVKMYCYVRLDNIKSLFEEYK